MLLTIVLIKERGLPMGKALFKKRYLVVLCVFVIMVGFLFTAPPKAISAEKVINWNFSLWGGKRAWSAPLHDWVADMAYKTNGRWKIKLHYGGVLAPPKENYDGIKAGMFEAAGICAAYTPGKNPLHTVSELPFIAPNSNMDIIQMMVEIWKHPALKKELLKWNAVPLLPSALCQYHLMGNKAVRTVKDLDGARIRIGGEIAKVLQEFGAVPTLVPAPEVYEAVSRGTIDLVGFPWTYGYGSFKTYEVSKYVSLPLSLGTMSCFYIANKDAWDALPQEFKNYHMLWYSQSPGIWHGEFKKADDKWIPTFKKYVEFVDFPKSERDKIVAKAEAVYERWVQTREKEGLPGRDVLNYYLEKRKEMIGY
jgi:TRAP-type C4-dicarboxylate transport system substrate-binding protein